MAPSTNVTTGTVIGGDFRVIEPLRSGGMGSVFVVEQKSTGKRRALKLMHADLVQDPKLRERFEQEAKVGALVASDHVVEVIGAGIDPGTNMPFIAMELLDGEDLAHWVAKNGAPPLHAAREILAELCHALGAAHEAGVVHRDLKPENVFLARTRSAAGKRTVKVLDFGIAKLVAHARTKATAAVGTPAWMAPEQTDPRAAITAAADVWALGLLAFWLLTGRPYWLSAADPTSSVHAMMREVLFEPIEAPSLRARDKGAPGRLPTGFDAWFAKCVTRDLATRFADAKAAFAAFGDLGPVDTEGASQAAAAAPLPAEQTDPMSTRSYLASTDPKSEAIPTAAQTPPPSTPPISVTSAPTLPASSEQLAAAAAASAPAPRPIPAPTLVAPQLSGTSAPTVVTDGAPAAAGERKSPVFLIAAALGAAAIVALVVSKPWSPAPTPAAPSSAPSLEPPIGSAASSASAPVEPESPTRAAAMRAVEERVSSIKTTCKGKDGPRTIEATVTFKPSGTVQSATVDQMGGTGFCVSTMLNALTVPRFTGAPETVTATISLDDP